MLSGEAWDGTRLASPSLLSRHVQKDLLCCPGDKAGGCPSHRRADLPLPCQLRAGDALPLQVWECWEPVVGAARGACLGRWTGCSQLLGSVEEPCTKESSCARSELHLRSANGCLKQA